MKKKIALYAFCVLFTLTAAACGTKEVPSESVAGNNTEKENPSNVKPEDNGDGEGDGWIPDAPISYEAVNVFMEIEDRVYFMNEESIPFQIINQSGKQIGSALIPVLERWNGTEWEAMKCTAGFCGTQGGVGETADGSALLEWYPELEPGDYRISVSLTTKDGDVTVSDSFLLLEDENSLPVEGEAVITMDVVVQSEGDSKKVNYTLTNLSEKEAFFGLDFMLERQEGNEWAAVLMKEGVGWNSIGLILPAGSFHEESIDLNFYYEILGEGKYRLTKTVYMDTESSSVLAEFELKD